MRLCMIIDKGDVDVLAVVIILCLCYVCRRFSYHPYTYATQSPSRSVSQSPQIDLQVCSRRLVPIHTTDPTVLYVRNF